MVSIKHFLEKTELILIISIVLPLLFAVDVSKLKFAMELTLGTVMFFSIRPFLRHKFNFSKYKFPIITSILTSYVVLSGIYLILAYLFFGVRHEFFTGYLLIAIIPPAISIVPMCYLAKCDPEAADSSIFISFIISLFVIPGSIYLLFGRSIDFILLLKILAFIIVIPVILAYIFIKSKSAIFHYGKIITNLCLGAVIFISISLNRSVFLHLGNTEILYVYLVNILAIFGTGIIIYYLSKKLTSGSQSINYALYASQKNVGTSITIGIFLFSPKTAVPAIIALVLQFIFFIFVEEVFVKRHLHGHK